MNLARVYLVDQGIIVTKESLGYELLSTHVYSEDGTVVLENYEIDDFSVYEEIIGAYPNKEFPGVRELPEHLVKILYDADEKSYSKEYLLVTVTNTHEISNDGNRVYTTRVPLFVLLFENYSLKQIVYQFSEKAGFAKSLLKLQEK